MDAQLNESSRDEMGRVGKTVSATHSADSLRFFRALPAAGAPGGELALAGVVLVTISC